MECRCEEALKSVNAAFTWNPFDAIHSEEFLRYKNPQFAALVNIWLSKNDDESEYRNINREIA